MSENSVPRADSSSNIIPQIVTFNQISDNIPDSPVASMAQVSSLGNNGPSFNSIFMQSRRAFS